MASFVAWVWKMRFQFCTIWFRFDLRKKPIKSNLYIRYINIIPNTRRTNASVFVCLQSNMARPIMMNVVDIVSISCYVKLIGICQLLVENVTPQFSILNTIDSSCMLFTHLSDGLPWYTGWAIFNVLVHSFIISALDPTHSTGTDVVIDMSISLPSNTSYTVFSGFAKQYIFIMTKMSKWKKMKIQNKIPYCWNSSEIEKYQNSTKKVNIHTPTHRTRSWLCTRWWG